MTWYPSDYTATSDATTPVWNGSFFLTAANDNQTTYRSFNGANWSLYGTLQAGSRIMQIAWNGSFFFAAASVSGAAPFGQRSPDGSNWTRVDVGAFQNSYWGFTIAWNGSMWVMGGGYGGGTNIRYSYDAVTWFAASAPFNWEATALAWNGSMWVCTGSDQANPLNGIAWSSNGINWNAATSGQLPKLTTQSSATCVSWNGRMWLVGCADFSASGPGSNIFYSYDGKNWSNAIVSGGFPGSNSWEIAPRYMPGAIGNNQMYYAPDFSSRNMKFYLQDQANYLTVSHQISATTSTLVINNTMFIDRTNNRVGINNPQPAYTLDVVGAIRVTSTIVSDIMILSNNTPLTSSDSNIKENIVNADLSMCYNNVKTLPLRRFNYISSIADSKVDKTQIGFIAQELQNHFPRSVIPIDDIYHVNYDQAFLSHFGTTQFLISTVDGRALENEQLFSTTQGKSVQIQTLRDSYETLVSQVSTLMG
jgi:hypothetical protein